MPGVYGGAISPMPLIQMFDKQINIRMGQANVRRWIDDAPRAYEIFQKKQDGAFKILLQP